MPGPAVPAFLSPSSTLTWVLAGFGVYWLALIALRNRGLLPSYVGTQGPIVTIHTKRGREFLDRLSKPKRFWRAWANVGVGISLVVMLAMFAVLLTAAFGALQTTETTQVQQPQNVLVIPGVNDFLPLSATPGIVFGLLVGLVVHEGGHGLLCRVEGIDIESMGVATLAILPIGAFVEPDAEDQYEASRGGQTRMFAAGVTFNFAVTIVAFALLFGPVAGAITVAPGAAVGGVAPGSSAGEAGIEPNDRITAVDGTAVETNDELSSVLGDTEAGEVTVEVDGDREVTVERSLLVTAAVPDGPTSVSSGDTIRAVDGEPVATEADFRSAVGGEEVVTLTVERDGDREDRTAPIGAALAVVGDGPFAEAGAPVGDGHVVTSIDGERTYSYGDLQEALGERSPGEEVTIVSHHDGDREEYAVTLGERNGGAFLGVQGVEGVSGLVVSDLGVDLYPATEYLAVLGGDADLSDNPVLASFADSFLGKSMIVLLLPIAGVVGVLPFNFAGFTAGVENFFVVQGPLAGLGETPVFVAANLLFWTGWINVQLGFFNCIPAFPLDGGHILRTTTEAVVSRLPVDATRGMVRTVTTTVGLTMLVSFLVMVFGPTLLS